jgi:hypothetical protein
MSRRVKRFFIFSSVIIFVSWYIFDSTLLKKLTSLTLGELLSTPSFLTEVDSASIHWLGMEASHVSLHGKSAFQSLLLDSLHLDCKRFETLTGQPNCSSKASLYSGTANVDFNKKNDRFFINGNISGLKLSQHILIRGYGIEDGTLSVKDLSMTTNGNHVTDATGNLEILGVKKPSVSRLSPSLTGLPIPIELPAVDIDSLKATITYKEATLECNDISLSSSLGELKGAFQVKTNKLSSMQISLALSDKGKEILIPYLLFICSKDALSKELANPLIFEFKNHQIQCHVA